MNILSRSTLLALFSLSACYQASTSDLSVVRGREVAPSSPAARSVVALVQGDRPFCTGTLIAKDTILSAAHCVEGERADQIKILFGRKFGDANATVLPVKSIHMFREEGAFFFPNHDVAILKLSVDAPANYEPAEILRDPASLKADETKVLIAGYGLTKTSCRDASCSGSLLEADMLFRQYHDSAQMMSLLVFEGKADEGFGGSCNGDSGGPAYAEINGRWYLIGLTNGVNGIVTPEAMRNSDHCENGWDIYTFAGDYLPWIETTRGGVLRNAYHEGNAPRSEPPFVMKGPDASSEPQSWADWINYPNYKDPRWATVAKILETMAYDSNLNVDKAERIRLFLDPAFSTDVAQRMETLNLVGRSAVPIRSLEPVRYLTKLRKISIGDQKIQDFSVLGALPELETLALGKNQVSIDSSVDSFPNLDAQKLKSLEISGTDALAVGTLPWKSWSDSLQNLSLNVDGDFDWSKLDFGAESRLESLSIKVKQSHGSIPASSAFRLKDLKLYQASKDPLTFLNKTHLESLESLTINDGSLSSGDFIAKAGVTNLRSLSLQNNRLQTIDFLSDMPSLEDLKVDGNAISDFSPVLASKGLLTLGARENPVKEMPCPSQAKCFYDRFPEPKTLGEFCKNLATDPGVSYFYSYVNTIDALENSQGTTFLTPWTDERCDNLVRQLPDPKKIELRFYLPFGNNLAPLGAFANLESLKFAGLSGIDLATIGALPQLKELDATFITVKGQETIGRFPSLSSLKISSTESGTLDGLSSPSLTKLDASAPFLPIFGEPLKSLGVLGELPRIQSIGLRYSAFSDFSGLSGYTTLRNLDLTSSRLEDLSPFAENLGLEVIVSDTPFDASGKPCPIISGICLNYGASKQGPGLGMTEASDIPRTWADSEFIPGVDKTISL